MKLIYIYGPPASGKLTVAKELEKLTKYKLFHNHLINDVISEIMDFEHPKFWKFTDRLKLEVFGLASRFNVGGMIFTQTYVGGSFPKKAKKIIEKYDGRVYFVKLEPSKEELMKRVCYVFRKKYQKFSSKNELKKFMEKNDAYRKASAKNQMIIDNTCVPSKKVAEMIVKNFKLRRLL